MVDEGSGPEGPVLRVVAGQASPEELAALAAVLATRQRAARQQASRQQASADAAPRSAGWTGWPDRAALLHAPLLPGPGAWRRAVRPR